MNGHLVVVVGRILIGMQPKLHNANPRLTAESP